MLRLMTQIGVRNFEELYVIEIVIDSFYLSVYYMSSINYVSCFSDLFNCVILSYVLYILVLELDYICRQRTDYGMPI